MAWTAEQMAQKRAKLQKKTNAAAGGAEPLSQRKSADSRNPLALGSTGNSVSDNSNPWTAEKMAEKRAALQTQKQQTGTDLYSTALEDYRTRNNLGFADAMDNRSDELNRQKVTVSPAGKGTWYGQQAQKLKNSYAEYSQPDAFDQANQWFDQPRNQELVNKLLEKKSNYTSYAETGTSRNGASAGDGSIDPFRTTGIKGKVGNTYSTADLKKLGYTDTEIRQAREYLDTMEEIPEWKQLARRTANTVGGVADTVAAAPLMGAEYLVQAGKNIRQSSENRKALEAELARNPREKNLYDQLMETDMDYQPKYSTGDLLQQGFTRQEIEDMRSRIAGTEAKGGIDTEKSVGYQLYNRGQQLTGAAQSGLTDVQRTVQGVATSAAENLAVAAINPAAVLPVLSAQGAADAMGKSAAKDESAGKALVGGVAKFGAGWAINSVGAADLARTMGADYARNSVAGAVADKIRALAGDSAFAAAHPAVANAISGGIDNAVQAFVETYADKAIDAALGDSEAAQTMFTTDTLVQALEAGLTGGASGALGGAVGTGLSRMNAGDSSLRGNVERYAAQDEYEQALKEHQRREELAREPEPLSQRVGADSPPNSGALGMSVESDGTEKGSADLKAAGPAAEGNSAETAAISDNLAVQTFAEAAAGDSLTGKTIRLFNPEAGNEANRAAFEEAYGVKLPSTAAATWRMLREVAAQRSQQNAVENAGESVESSTETAADGAEPLSQRISADSPPSMGAIGRTGNVELTAQNGADRQAVMQSVPVEESTLDGMDSSNSPMRETYGMEAPKTEGQKQARTEQVLRSWKVGEKAAQEISLKQPEGVDSDRYAAAASTLYRLGQMEDVKTFDQALELAGTGSGMAANVNYVLGNLKGRNALKIAYTYGRDAAETRWAKSQLGGNLTEQSLTGRGETIYKGTLRNANDAGSQVIELNAAATGTTAVLKNVLQNGAGQADSRVRAYVDTETARIFFGDSAQDTFGTVLHEDYHWYNALDSEGAKTLQDHALLYLARSSGFETVDEMIREKMTDYAQQNLTYEEAAEELVGDAWRGIFSNESDFKRWVEFQRGQAEKNSGRAGTIRTVMNRVKEMLGGIVSRAKEVLTLDPDNRAALKAQRLAENERRILQDEYFAHAEKAMDNLRSAKENAAALKTESAAEGRSMRFQLQEGEETLEKQLNRNLGRLEQMTPAAEITGKEIEYGATSKENAENIVRFFESIGGKVERDGFGVVELTRKGAKATVQHGNGPVKQIAAAAIPNVIRYGEQIGFVENWKGRGYNTHTFVAPVVVDGIKIYEAVIVNEYTVPNAASKFYVHEVCGSDGSLLTIENGKITKKESSLTTVLKTEQGDEAPKLLSKNSIAQENAESKGNSEPVKKSVRFQLSAPVEVDKNKDLVAVHNLTAENLQEALELGGMPSPSIAVVKAQEGHTKYGPISLVFNSDTIDPMVNRANRIYGSDAWTPTRPNVEFEVNYDAMRDFESKVDSASKDAFEGKFANSAALQRLGIEETSSSDRAELAQRLEENTAVQLAYLEAKGKTVEPAYKTERDQFDSLGNDTLEKVIEHIGADEIKAAFEGGDFDQLDQLADKAADALEEKYTHGQLEGQNRRWQMRIDKMRNDNRGRLYGMLEHAYKMLTDTNAGKQAMDVEATREAIRQEAPAEDVKNWVYDQLGNVLGQKGIRNGKDRFTPAGIKRSFAQLHNSYTLENLVAAMNAQNARGQDTWGLSASTLMSTATAEYQNLDEVRADKGRLQQMPEEEYKALLEKADDQISDILDKLRRETTPHADNSFEEREILGGILMQAAQGKQTAAAIGKAFAKEGYTIGKDTAQMILNLYKNVAAIPTGYFEAKPQRAVGFDEVRAAILPDNTSSTLIDSLKETGIDVKLYKAGDDAQRTALLNKVPNVRFQLAEQAERDARKNTQRQASRAIADNSAAMETLAQMMGVTHGVRISQDSIDGLAVRWTKANGSRADRTKIAGETRALVEYMTADGASMSKASALSETIADEILSGATYRNTELWDEYPEYHDLSYTVNKDGPAKAELVKRYGTWSEAVAEARKHGVKLRQAEGVRDGNPAEVYESIVNDTRAMGGTKEGAAALFRGAAQEAGVDGAASMESTEWLDVLMNVHDAIKPRMMSRFADAAEYEDAKVELADRMLGDILNVPEMTDAQAIFDGFQRWQRQAVAAAVGEENAEQALKDLRKVQKEQKEQNREFNRRMYENSRNGSRDEALRQWTEQQKRNEKAEKLLDQNLDTLGLDITNYGDMAEKLDVLKEAYEREWKAEKKRLKEERQQMLDEIRLENKQLKRENWNLSHQVAGEQRRADRAEWQLIHQENELLEWEQENQRKAQEWQEKQAERNAIAITAAQQQRDEDIAIAKKLAEKRVQKARDGRQKDELRRGIRANAAQLNQMILRPSKDRYVQPHLIQQAAEVAKLADMTLLNDHAVARLTALRTSIMQSMGAENSSNGISEDWKLSKVPELIDALQADLNASKQAQLDRLNQQLTEAEALPDSEKAEMLRDRLRKRIRETENRTYLPMTVDQMRMLKAITTSTLHVIRTANKTLSLQKAEAVDKIANEAAAEVRQSKGNDGKLRSALTRYNLDMLGAGRVFRMLGGYAKNSQMEKLGTMLNDGQREQTRITVEGTKLFDNVTGKANLRQMEKFAGPGAELVDIGLKDSKGRAAPLTHAQLCSLYMHLQNADSREHLLNGGLTIPDAEEYNRGDIEKAYQKGQTVKIGMLKDSAGNPMADTVIQAVEKAMTDYDRAWCEDMKNFFGSYTTNLINETSMKLLGYQRATVKNYYPIAVDKTALATQIEGVKLDATIEGRGFLKNRVKSQMPILLEECSSVVQRSLRDTAAYAGLAAPIRDVQKVLNSSIETEDGIKMLKNGILKEQWGQSATNYIDDLLTDLQTTQRKRSTTMTKVLDRLRGNYAGAILTLNPGVAIAQAASLPTAGAVLGADTMAAVVPFVKNLSGKQRAALEQEIAQHGDVLLRYRLRGSQRGELASIGVSQGAAEKAMDKLPKWVTGWINSMDEITVAALWEGSKRYVEHHTNEFAEGAATKGSEAYWEAVNKMYQRVIEETQPNYTTMQRAGIQRNPDQMTKTLTMFTTQRFQNYGIMADAVMDYNAQKARDKAAHSSETAEEVKRAGKNLNRAIVSQITQTAVFALMKIGADFLLHRWDREQDENGDVTAASVSKRFLNLYTESFAGNFLYGSELYSAVGNAVNGTDYDVVSATNISAVNDLFAAVTKFSSLVRQDTGDMTEEQLEAYHQKLRKAGVNLMQYGFEIAGVPMGNARKMLDAFDAYVEDARGIASGSGFSFSSTPTSATGQYDRLYNAIAEGDTDNASGAMAKLEAMGKDEKTIASQLKNRLKKYSPEVEQAAQARNEGKDSQRQELTKQLVREMYETLGIREGVKADAEKRTWVIDLVTEAIESKAEELYKGGTEGSVYDDLTEAVDTGRTSDVQDEIRRLRTAGKEDGSIKTKITAAVKEEYLAGNDHDREKLEKLLTSLTKEDGTAMYEEKNFAQWVKDAAKKEEQAKNSKDEWAGVR